MDIPIHFHHQRGLVTVKVDDKPHNDLLPPKVDSQFIRPQFLPQNLFSESHVTAEFFCTLKFFFGDFLTCDDILDRHGGVLMQNSKNPPPTPKPPPLPCGKGRGDRSQAHTPITRANQVMSQTKTLLA